MIVTLYYVYAHWSFSLQPTGSIAVAQCNLRANGPPSPVDPAPSWTASTALEVPAWLSGSPTASYLSTPPPSPLCSPRCRDCPPQVLWLQPQVTIAPARFLRPAPHWVCCSERGASPAVWSSLASRQLRGETPATRSPPAPSTSS